MGGGGGMKGDFPEAAGENFPCSSLLSNSLGLFNTVSHIRVTKKATHKTKTPQSLAAQRQTRKKTEDWEKRKKHTHTRTHKKPTTSTTTQTADPEGERTHSPFADA